ncbi:InlB B-repeat-containing protein [Mycoplasmatota bacterium]|nr:InlB B-repeat-containing protein [Mycoplasmatota bacterium]
MKCIGFKIKKSSFILWIMLFSLFTLGISYSSWTDSININTTSSTGEFNAKFITDLETVLPKSVLSNWRDSNNRITDNDTVEIELGNLFPGAIYKTKLLIKNTGSIPATLTDVIIENSTTNELDEHVRIDIEIGNVAESKLLSQSGSSFLTPDSANQTLDINTEEWMFITISVLPGAMNNTMDKSVNFELSIFLNQFNNQVPFKNQSDYSTNQYTITYKDYDDTIIYSETTDYNQSLTSISNPTREGYTFTGWGQEIPLTMPASNIELTAEYNINQYTVSYKDYDDTIIYSETIDYNQSLTSISNPTREGYTFTGWGQEIPLTMPASNIELTAEYNINQYTVSYKDYDDTIIYSETIDYNQSLTSISNPTREGYTFTGWGQEIPLTMPASNIELTAEYNINQYTVSYKDYDDTIIYSETIDYNQSLTSTSNPTREGYTFTGWGQEIPLTMPASNIELTAEYNINQYTVSYKDYDDTIIYSETTDYNQSLTSISNPTREGYTFTGWNQEIALTMPANNIELTAEYNINQYTVSYKDYDDTIIYSETTDYNQSLTSISNPTREGYTFTGWNQEIPLTMPASNIELTAEYNINQYTVSYKDYDDTIIYSETIDYNQSLTSISNPTREGYTFTGWGQEIPLTMPANNIELTAEYTINEHTLTYLDYNEIIINTRLTEYNSIPINVPIPSRSGFSFTGWNDGVIKYKTDLSDFVMLDEDVSLIASYARKISPYSSLSIETEEATKPTVTLIGDQQVFIEYGSEYIEQGATAVDFNGLTDITDSIVINGVDLLDINTLGTYLITYTAKGALASESAQRRVDVVDTTPPVIDFINGDVVYVEVSTEYKDPGFMITDNYDALTVDDVIVDGIVDTSIIASRVVTYTVQDSSLNVGIFKRIIHVVPDITPPVLILNSNGVESIEKGSLYLDEGLKVIDKSPTEIVVEGNLDTNTIGSYELKYIVTDSYGNQSSITRIVKVIDESESKYLNDEVVNQKFSQVVSPGLEENKGAALFKIIGVTSMIGFIGLGVRFKKTR